MPKKPFSMYSIVKFRYSETVTKIWKILPLCFDITRYLSKQGGIFFLIMWPSHTIWSFVCSIFSTKSFCTEHCRVVLFEPHLKFFLRVFIVKNEEYACLQLHKFTLQNLENSLDQRYELLKFDSDKKFGRNPKCDRDWIKTNLKRI